MNDKSSDNRSNSNKKSNNNNKNNNDIDNEDGINDKNSKDNEDNIKINNLTISTTSIVAEHFSVEELNDKLSDLSLIFNVKDIRNIISNYLSLLPRFFFAKKLFKPGYVSTVFYVIMPPTDEFVDSHLPTFITVDGLYDRVIADEFSRAVEIFENKNNINGRDNRNNPVQTLISNSLPLLSSIAKKIIQLAYLPLNSEDEKKKLRKELYYNFSSLIEDKIFHDCP